MVLIQRRTQKIATFRKRRLSTQNRMCGVRTKPLSTKKISTANTETVSETGMATDRKMRKWGIATANAASPRSMSSDAIRCAVSGWGGNLEFSEKVVVKNRPGAIAKEDHENREHDDRDDQRWQPDPSTRHQKGAD